MNNNRIEFIDLAKGICIILVVMYHCGLGGLIPGDKQLRMPLYFVLSGLFFKDYGSDSIIKKTNKLIIPYISFYILGDIFYWLAFKFGILSATPKAFPIIDMAWGGIPCNLPIWFLLCLFNCYVIFLFISRISKSTLQIALYTSIIGIIGACLSACFPNSNYFFISSAFSAIPFFYFGYFLRNTNVLQYTHHRAIDFSLGLLLYGIAILLISYFPNAKFNVFDNTFHGNVIMSYLISSCLVLAILLICKSFRHIIYISFIGRFSIIILLIHVPIMEFTYFFQRSVLHYEANWLRAILTIFVASCFIIPMKRYTPYICAQKDLLSIESLKLRISRISVKN